MTDQELNQAIQVAADSIQQLRSVDVYRVLEWYHQGSVRHLAENIIQRRPDLAEECDNCLWCLEGERIADDPYNNLYATVRNP